MRVLELETTLEKEREHLARLRRKHYELAGGGVTNGGGGGGDEANAWNQSDRLIAFARHWIWKQIDHRKNESLRKKFNQTPMHS